MIYEVLASILVILVGYFLLTLAREKRILFIRQVSYDAVAYSTEASYSLQKWSGKKLTSDEKLMLAVEYMKSIFPFMSRKQAAKHCISIIAKSPAIGATGGYKI